MNLDGIILAGGLSRRLGRPKQLVKFRGVPLVRHVTDAALGSRLREVILVTGHDSERVREAVAACSSPRLRIIVNTEYAEGQAASIRYGVRAVSEHSEGAMFLSCDQPLINAAYLNALIEAFERRRPLVCYPVFEGRRSNPTIFASSLFPDLLTLSGDVGGRVLIERYRHRALEHPVSDARRFTDVDDEEDLKALEQLEPLDDSRES